MVNAKAALLLVFASLLHFATNVNAIIGNDATILICYTGINSNCGFWATYTNGKSRQTASRTSFFSVLCALASWNGVSNAAGFWAKPTLLGSDAGWHIGYTPTGKSMNMGDATWTNKDPAHLNARCNNEFGWNNVDPELSRESFWADLPVLLFDN
ncbi:MAG: hypothetical protein M1840_003609 [Geoglossum simile]|nr:MAG: hypothetical protein M1840_003609 [Geoglossum simile]